MTKLLPKFGGLGFFWNTVYIFQLLISYSEYHRICAKNYESWLAVDKVIAIIGLLFGPPCRWCRVAQAMYEDGIWLRGHSRQTWLDCVTAIWRVLAFPMRMLRRISWPQFTCKMAVKMLCEVWRPFWHKANDVDALKLLWLTTYRLSLSFIRHKLGWRKRCIRYRTLETCNAPTTQTAKNIIHCVSKKVHTYDFHDNNVKWKPI